MANLKVIGKVTVGSGGAANIEFTNIPATYTDLVVKLSGRTTSNDDQRIEIQFNNSTSNLSQQRLYGEGTNTAADAPAGAIQPTALPENDYTANTFGNFEMYISNYASSNSKAISIDTITENSSQTAYQMLVAGLWSNSSAITSIKLIPMSSGNFVQHSTAYLYGVSNVTTGSKATGGIVYSNSTHYYHVFPYSGTFTPTESITADYLIVAGGGSGGPGYQGGGGGAGGYRYLTSQSLTAQAYTVTIGAGGAGVTGGTSARGNNGSDSVFNSVTSTGGGGGGTFQGSLSSGNSGGSGGGAGALGSGTGGAGNTPSTSPSQGNAGGNTPTYADPYSGGGGGGAGAAGTNGGNQLGNGGDGTSNSITGVPVTYAGGGGGGASYAAAASTGGTGGGGSGANGPNAIAAVAGTANTGGGGGGGGDNTQASAAGGSGIVIIRYAI